MAQHLVYGLKIDVFELVPLCQHHYGVGMAAGCDCVCAHSHIVGADVPPGAAHGVIPLEFLHGQVIKDELLRHLCSATDSQLGRMYGQYGQLTHGTGQLRWSTVIAAASVMYHFYA